MLSPVSRLARISAQSALAICTAAAVSAGTATAPATGNVSPPLVAASGTIAILIAFSQEVFSLTVVIPSNFRTNPTLNPTSHPEL